MKVKSNCLKANLDVSSCGNTSSYDNALKSLSDATNKKLKNALFVFYSELAEVDVQSKIHHNNMISSLHNQHHNLNVFKLGLQKLRQILLDINHMHYIKKDKEIAAKEVECKKLEESNKELKQKTKLVNEDKLEAKGKLLKQNNILLQENKELQVKLQNNEQMMEHEIQNTRQHHLDEKFSCESARRTIVREKDQECVSLNT